MIKIHTNILSYCQKTNKKPNNVVINIQSETDSGQGGYEKTSQLCRQGQGWQTGSLSVLLNKAKQIIIRFLQPTKPKSMQ